MLSTDRRSEIAGFLKTRRTRLPGTGTRERLEALLGATAAV